MPYVRYKIIQVDDSPNANPVRVEFEINQPKVAERYHSINLRIDDSNCTRQDDFQLERKLQTKDWSIRVNTSILGMNVVYTYYLGKSCKCRNERNPSEFQYNLADDMIENRWTERSTRINKVEQPIEDPEYINRLFLIIIQLRIRVKEKPDCLKDIKFLAQSICKVCKGLNTDFLAIAVIMFVMINMAVSV